MDGLPPKQLIEQELRLPQISAQAAEAANIVAAAHTFSDYQARIDPNTLRRQRGDLLCFARFLHAVGAIPSEPAIMAALLYREPQSWAALSHGLVTAFLQWQIQQGYAVGSINVRLATIKRYCGLAHSAGIIDQDALILIRSVRGYAKRQAITIDEHRQARGVPTRQGQKKAAARTLSGEELRTLKDQPQTAQGSRDWLMICLLTDHGLRVGELAVLKHEDLDMKRGELRFYREKVQLQQTHRLSADTLRAALAYLEYCGQSAGLLLRGSRKNGVLWGNISTRSIRERIRQLGEQAGLGELSPHDLRHTWASRAVRGGSDPFALRDAGGWRSLEMPNRYVAAAQIANERIKLEE